MTQSKTKKIKKIGDFYVTKINAKKNIIIGIYFDKKYEKFIKIKDRQAYLWFTIFAILEGIFRSYIYEIVIWLAIAIFVANVIFHVLFVKREKLVEIVLSENEFYSVVDKKHRAWRQTLTMTLVFVCLARLLLFVQPDVFSDFEITSVYLISLVLSFFSIAFWLYYGGIKNQMKQLFVKPTKKNVKKIKT